MKTYIATDSPEKVIMVEDGEISHAINPKCEEWADYETHIAEGGQMVEPQPTPAHTYIGGAWQLDEQELSRLRSARREQLKQEREARIAEPIDNVQVGRQQDRDRITRAVNRWEEGGFGESRNWIMADNSVQPLTKAQLQGVLDQYDMRELLIFNQYQGLCGELETSNDPVSVVWA